MNDTEGSVVWGLYFHLWKKTHKGNPCPDINLPHTVMQDLVHICFSQYVQRCTHATCMTVHAGCMQVLYQDSRPIAWYFTSLKENKVCEKHWRSTIRLSVHLSHALACRTKPHMRCVACAHTDIPKKEEQHERSSSVGRVQPWQGKGRRRLHGEEQGPWASCAEAGSIRAARAPATAAADTATGQRGCTQRRPTNPDMRQQWQ